MKSERFDLPGAPRLNLRGTVPIGLAEKDLKAILCSAAKKAASPAYGAVSLLAYTSPKNVDGIYDAGKADYAPRGDWSKADPSVDRDAWSVSYEIAVSYLAPKPAIVAGAIVVLEDDLMKAVQLSRTPDRWGDEDSVGRVPNKTRAKIVDRKEFPSMNTLVRYQVEVVGSKLRGWVSASEVRAIDAK